MREVLRVGVVGCGAIGQAHLEVWSQTDGARVTAVCDAVAARADDTARAVGAVGFQNLEEMAVSGLVDAVDICTPSGLHADQGLVGARAGLHVLVEKPLDLDLSKAELLVSTCEERDLVLACVLQRRSYAGASAVAKAVHEGKLGRILSCSAYVKWWRAQSYYDSSGWRGSIGLDGGVLANQAIHAIDHLCWLAGAVDRVEFAFTGTESHRMEAEDHALAVLRFESGAHGVIEATTCCSPPLCSRVEIYGTDGSAAFDDVNVVEFGYGGESRLAEVREGSRHADGRSEAMSITLAGHQAVARDFVAAIRDRRPPLVSGREALKSVAALCAIYDAARR